VVRNILGDRISNITNYNITKWALKRSKILSKLSQVELEKLLETSDIKDYEDGDKVYKKGEVPKYLAICLDGMID
jgi:signal-transduction protein with cAMP-binding, CBS, and nucleotidyltransferase domain